MAASLYVWLGRFRGARAFLRVMEELEELHELEESEIVEEGEE